MGFFRQEKKEIKAGDTILDTDFTEVKNDDGTTAQVTVGELTEAYRARKKQQEIENAKNAKKNEKMVGDDDEIEVDGEMVNMSSLKECYSSMKKNEKKNAEEEAKKKEKDEEEMKNAEEEAKKKAKEEEEEKTNSTTRFKEITNAHNKSANPEVKIIETIMDRVKRGNDRYTFNKKAS